MRLCIVRHVPYNKFLVSHTFLPFKTRRSVLAVYVYALSPVIGVMVAGTVLISLRWITFITDTTLDSDNRALQGHRWILRTRVHVSAEQSCYYLGMDFPLGKDWVRYDWIRVCGEYCQPEWAEWGVNRIINDGDEERHELSWWEWELFTGPTPPPDTSELCQSVHTEIDTL